MLTNLESKILGKRAILCASRSIGVKEETSNWGRWVKVYLFFVKILYPAPWCAAFVAYKIHQAAGELRLKTSWPKEAYVQTVVNWAKKHSNIYSDPRPGMAFVVYHPELKRYAHIGFIKEIDNNGNFLTIEGNSNTDGSREGREVVSRWRKWNSNKHKCIKII